MCDRQVHTSNGSFYVQRRGPQRGPTLVFVAGLGDDHTSWSGVIERLEDSYDCVSFDNRGIGSSVVSEGPYTTTQLAADAHAICEELKLGKFVAIGSSMGGAIVQEWALAQPEDLCGIVLSNTWAEQDPWTSLLFAHWKDLAENRESRRLLEQLALFCFSPPYFKIAPGEIGQFLNSTAPDLDGFASSASACATHNTLSRLGAIQLPTLVISGSMDILTRPELSSAIIGAISHARHVSLATGHMTFWEKCAEWAKAVTDFVQSIDCEQCDSAS